MLHPKGHKPLLANLQGIFIYLFIFLCNWDVKFRQKNRSVKSPSGFIYHPTIPEQRKGKRMKEKP
jgi:hypothetical protein